MRSFQPKNSFRRFIESWPFLIFFGLILLIFAYNIALFFGKALETNKNKNLAEQKLVGLQNSKKDLEENIKKLNTEKGIDESIRNKFGVAKDGEGVVVIVDEKGKDVPVESTKANMFLSFFNNLFK